MLTYADVCRHMGSREPPATPAAADTRRYSFYLLYLLICTCVPANASKLSTSMSRLPRLLPLIHAGTRTEHLRSVNMCTIVPANKVKLCTRAADTRRRAVEAAERRAVEAAERRAVEAAESESSAPPQRSPGGPADTTVPSGGANGALEAVVHQGVCCIACCR
jgi:hypothetical protein